MKRKSVDNEFNTLENRRSSRKRLRSLIQDSDDDFDHIEPETPSKSAKSHRKGVPNFEHDPHSEQELEVHGSENDETPSIIDELIEQFSPNKRARGRPKIRKTEQQRDEPKLTPTKSLLRKALFSTPTKPDQKLVEIGSPSIIRNADRSARRKSARTLIEQTVADNISDDEEEDLARDIYNIEEEDEPPEAAGTGEEDDASEIALETPSKRGRGRPKGSKTRKRLPSPPQDLPPHELYFSQNRGGGSKTSNNNLSSLALLDHEEYFKLTRSYRDPHEEDMSFLQDLHAHSFNQWQFELSQSFNICIYGWGSKRTLLTSFATHLYNSRSNNDWNKIVVVNGYIPTVTPRDILNTLASALSKHQLKLGAQPTEMLETLCSLLEEDESQHITLIIHSIDAPPLRRSTTQTLLSRIASHPQIHLVTSADHPSFPLLWDSSLRSTFNFLFHDCTTFQPYAAEVDVVNEVHELLGRSGRRVGGKDGVSFVLKSLPQNAKNLFRVLVAEQLAGLDNEDDFGNGIGNDGDDSDINGSGERTGMRRGAANDAGVEYRLLYQKAVEDFICGDEVSFRTLLKEFHDHQMIHSRKDAMGTEILSVPFRKEELETILEDLMA